MTIRGGSFAPDEDEDSLMPPLSLFPEARQRIVIGDNHIGQTSINGGAGDFIKAPAPVGGI